MKNYLISYDLGGNKSIYTYQNLHKAIKSATYWAKPLESVFFIKSNLSAIEIAKRLKSHIQKDDKLLVIEIGKDWGAINLPADVVNWLNRTL